MSSPSSPGSSGATQGRHVALIGGTATGKSAVALAIARDDPTWEIVTVDSMQVYRGMDIGTAKPTSDERAEVAHHLIDLADPWTHYDVSAYQGEARIALAAIEARGHRALLVGGTALYLRAVVDDLQIPGVYPEVRASLEAELASGTPVEALHGRLVQLDPAAADRMDPLNERRVTRALEVTLGSGQPFSSFGPGLDEHPSTPFRLIALRWERDVLDRRIADRFATQMNAGFVDEVAGLLAHPNGLGHTARQALGYREIAAHIEGGLDLDDCVALAVQRVRRFSRRQHKWFRRDHRIHWVDATDAEMSAIAAVRGLLG